MYRLKIHEEVESAKKTLRTAKKRSPHVRSTDRPFRACRAKKSQFGMRSNPPRLAKTVAEINVLERRQGSLRLSSRHLHLDRIARDHCYSGKQPAA